MAKLGPVPFRNGWGRIPLASPTSLLAAIVISFAAGCAGGATGESSTATPTGTRTSVPTASSTATPTATPLPDRTSCREIRGTQYRSPSERVFYLANCLPATAIPALIVVAGPMQSPPPPPTLPSVPPVAGAVTAIGDSVMLGAETQLRAAIPGVDFRATQSLQPSSGIDLIRQLKESGALGSTVIIHLGTNGTFTASQFDQMMALLADVDLVVFLNVRAGRSWQDSNNAMLAHKVPQYANARLVDWYAASAGHPEYFWNDGIHLRPAGARAYTALIAANL